MLLSLHGQNKDALAKTKLGAWEYDIVEPYFKCNMTDIMASLGLVQLRRYPGLLARRRELIARYDAAFAGEAVQSLAHRGEGFLSSGHLYLMRLLGKDAAYRNRFIERLAERNIAANVHYKPMPLLSAYRKRGFRIEDYPNAYAMFENEVSLPLHTCLTDEQADYLLHTCLELLHE